MSSTRFPEPPADLKMRVLEAARSRPSATRRQATIQTFVDGVASIAVGLSMFFAAGGLHATPVSVWYRLGSAAGWLILAAACTWGAMGRDTGLTMGRPLAWLAGMVVGTPLVAFGWMSVRCLASTAVWLDAPSLPCLALSLAMATLPFLTLLRARRRTDPVHPVALGAALGATSGAWAGVLVALRCPVLNPSHVLVGHILPLVILTALGAALGQSSVGVRRLS